ncbi:MAG: diguanylate cyclase domain-containing protein, partial [Bacillota bacterium]
ISQRLENFMPAQSLIARWGGDEFAVISYEDLYQTQFYLEKYYGEMENLSKELGFKISFSAGLSSLNQEDTVEQLFKRVDKVLYESKREGKARYKLS